MAPNARDVLLLPQRPAFVAASPRLKACVTETIAAPNEAAFEQDTLPFYHTTGDGATTAPVQIVSSIVCESLLYVFGGVG
jgi:hypothetical protein